MSCRGDLISKTLAGALLGFALAIALSGLFSWATPGGPLAPNKFQFVMWIVAPIWMSVLCTVYLFRSGKRAWLVLGAANGLAYAGYYSLRYLSS